MTSAVNLSSISIADFDDDEETPDRFAERVDVQFDNVAMWLDSQSQFTFEEMGREGLTVSLFIDLDICSDQMDLHLPPGLLSACGRLGLAIDINSF